MKASSYSSCDDRRRGENLKHPLPHLQVLRYNTHPNLLQFHAEPFRLIGITVLSVALSVLNINKAKF